MAETFSNLPQVTKNKRLQSHKSPRQRLALATMSDICTLVLLLTSSP